MTTINCRRCGHEWNYTGDLTDYTTCPDCSASTKIPSRHGSKTKRHDDEITELKERIRELEKENRELRRRRSRDTDRQGSKTSSSDGEKQDSNGSAVYDPTGEFKFL